MQAMNRCQFQLDLDWQHPPEVEAIEAWLTGCFDLTLPTAGEGTATEQPLTAVQHWLSSALRLQLALLQAARVPQLDPGKVLSLVPPSAERPSWQAHFAYHGPHPVSAALLRDTLIRTLRAMGWMSVHSAADRLHRRELFRALDAEWIQPLRQQQVGGGSTLPLLRKAHQLHVPVMALGNGLYQFGWGCRSTRLHRSASQRDSALAVSLTHHKHWTCQALRAGGFPVTDPQGVKSVEEAIQAARRLGWPVVVKPVNRDRGEGVTVGIEDESALTAAFEAATQSAGQPEVLIERQAEGHCHRLLVARGRLLYVVERTPVQVTGDGHRPIHDLIDAHNQRVSWMPPWSLEKPITLDAAMVAFLLRQGYRPASIPPAGVSVPLRPFDTLAWGGADVDRTSAIHPENRQLAERVAGFLGLDVAGIDLLTPDIRIPWFENAACINEVNFAPMLGMWPISEQYLPEFFRRICPEGGRIPVRLVCGDASAWSLALERQQQARREGRPGYLTRKDCTLQPDGQALALVGQTVGERCRALLLNDQVEALWVVVTAREEMQHLGLIDAWTQVEICARDPALTAAWESVTQGISRRQCPDHEAPTSSPAQALMHVQSGDLQRAIDVLRQSLRGEPEQPEVWCQLGVLLRRTGQLDDAIRCYDEATRQWPTLADAYFNRANACVQAQRIDAAVADYRQTIHLVPGHAGAHINLGLLFLNSLDDPAASLDCFQALLAVHPDHPEALFNGAQAWRALNQPQMAAAWLQRTVAIKPDHHRAWVNLALVQEALDQPAEALAALAEAVRLAPDCAEAYAAAGNLHKSLDQLPEAIAAYDTAVRLRPGFAAALVNRAAVHLVLRQWSQAEADLMQSLTQRPSWPDAQWHLGMLRLLQGQAREGWRLLESRWQTALASRPPLPTGAQYLDDSPLPPGVRVLLYSEQGLGDCLQFSRFIPELIRRGAIVSLVCPGPLHPLLQSLSPTLNLLTPDDSPPACDRVGGLLSLPFVLAMTPQAGSNAIPYLWPNPSRVGAWRQQLGPRQRPRIGVAWSGQAGRDLDRCRHTRRCIPLSLFSGLCRLPADFHALQKEVSTEDRALLAGCGIHWHGEQLGDFSDTAALMAAMDVVISIDTSVAHLAGAVGAPLWVLLPFTTDYRWTAAEAATPWYPSARLYRQSSPGDWRPLLEAVIADLQHVLAQGSASAGF